MPSRIGGAWVPYLTPSSSDQVGRPTMLTPTCAQAPGQLPTNTVKARAPYSISGITRDANGNPLGGCTVLVYITGSDRLYTKVVSDAGGNWRAIVGNNADTFYAVSFDATGQISGATANNLVAS